MLGNTKLRGGYGYNGNFTGVWQGKLPQTLHFISSKFSVAYIQPVAGGISALSPGTTELTAFDPLRPDLLYVLEVQAEDAFQWDYTAEDMTVTVGETQAREVEYTIQSPNEIYLRSVNISSSNPYVASVTVVPNSVTNDEIHFQVKGLSRGAAEINGKAAFDMYTYDGRKPMEAAFSFQIQVDEPPEDDIPTVRKELERFGSCSGYGYTGCFPSSSIWGERLPENLTYVSSNPAAAYIDNNGFFITLSAGTAVLTVTSTEEPACRYALTLHVEDRFDCEWAIKEVVVNPEYSCSVRVPSYQISSSGTLTNIEWTGSDPDILTDIQGGQLLIQGEAGGKSRFEWDRHLHALHRGRDTVHERHLFHSRHSGLRYGNGRSGSDEIRFLLRVRLYR